MKQLIRIGVMAGAIWGLAATATLASEVRVGSAHEARWTDTTTAAAKTSKEQAVLRQGRVATVTGEIVDVSCYLQLGKRGPAHIACGAGCIRNGQPIGLLADNGRLYLVIAEEHDPRRGGLVSIREFFADRVGQRAAVTGLLLERDGHPTLFIAGSPLTPPPATAQ